MMNQCVSNSKLSKPKYVTSAAYIASFTCAIHCLLAPFIVIFLPFLGHSSHHLWIEAPLLIASIAAGIYINYSGYCRHEKQHSFYLFFLGVGFWVLNVIFEMYHMHHAEVILLTLGSLFVFASYIVNHKLLKCCGGQHQH